MKKLSIFFVFLCLGTLVFLFKQPFLTIIGRINVADGIGRQTIEFFKIYNPTISTNLIPTEHSWKEVPQKIKRLAQKKRPELGTVILCQEPLYETSSKLRSSRNPDQLRIAYTMFETTRIPARTVSILNEYFDLAAVPDPFLIEVYRSSGVQIPVFYLPLGRDLSLFLNVPLKTQQGSPFTFTCLSSGIERKNLTTLIRAFHKAFGNRSDVRLLLNCRPAFHFNAKISSEIEKTGADNIILTRSTLDNAAYLDLLKSTDCYVNLSKGEGFSIQPREAMAMGIPVIATDNTAQHTLCASGLVRAVPSPIQEIASCEYNSGDLGFFFACEESAAVEALLDMKKNYDSFLQNAQKMREWVAETTHFPSLKRLYLSLVNPKEVLLGEENKITEKALITNSPELFAKYRRLVLKAR